MLKNYLNEYSNRLGKGEASDKNCKQRNTIISLISYFNWLFRGVKCMNVRKLDIMLKDSNNKPIPDGSAKSCQGGKSMKLFKSFRCNSLGHSGR